MKRFTTSAVDLNSALDSALASQQPTPATGSVAEGIEHWLALHSIGNKPRSIEFNQDIAKLIKANWPRLETPLEKVTQEECITFARAISHYCSSRYNGCVNAVRSFIPAAQFLPRKRIPHPDHRIPSPEEFDRLLTALDLAHRGNSGLMIRLLAHTGMRITEAGLLTWKHVKDDHIALSSEITKNGKPRCVPFIPGTLLVLKLLKQVSKGERVLPHISCKKAMLYACNLAGLPRYSHHTFRHYFASRCIVSGVDIPTVAKWLGHSDNGALLLRTYCHLLDEHSRAMADRVRLGITSNVERLVSLHSKPASNIIELSVPAEKPGLAQIEHA